MKITVTTAADLAGKSRRTIGRWIGQTDNGKVELAALRPHLAVDADDSTIVRADSGDAEAQTDLALMLLEAGQAEMAARWLSRAADKSPEAMHWLSRCYLRGDGVEQNADLGMMWLYKAAAAGHAIAREQTACLRGLQTHR